MIDASRSAAAETVTKLSPSRRSIAPVCSDVAAVEQDARAKEFLIEPRESSTSFTLRVHVVDDAAAE